MEEKGRVVANSEEQGRWRTVGRGSVANHERKLRKVANHACEEMRWSTVTHTTHDIDDINKPRHAIRHKTHEMFSYGF